MVGWAVLVRNSGLLCTRIRVPESPNVPWENGGNGGKWGEMGKSLAK